MRKSVIYTWVCGETGRPVYVGKTSMPIITRMRNHQRLAAKGDATPKYKWLRNSQSVKVVVLDSVPVSKSACVERRWVRRLSRRFKLLNCATAGSGNPGVGRVDWTPELIAMLGTIADSEIAKIAGCERKTVTYQRDVRGIPAAMDRTKNTPPPANGGWNKIALPNSIMAQLGTMPDYKLAEVAGVNKNKIAIERRSAGIPSYAAATGNNGRIKRGEPHRRWFRQDA